MSGRRRFGAIRKLPSGRFQVRFRDPATHLYRTAEQTFATKGDAGRWLSILEADMARGLWHDPRRGEVLLAEVAETWYSTKLHLRETTKHIYRVILDAHILPAFGEEPIGSITTLDVQVWIAALHQKTRCGPNTVAKTYKQLRTIMEMALDAGLIVRNPCRIKGAGTERLPEMRCAPVEEVAALAQAVEPSWPGVDPSGRVLRIALGRARRAASSTPRPVAQDCSGRRAVHGGERPLRLGPAQDRGRNAYGGAAVVHLRCGGRAPRPLEPARR